jgi:hypothetical protein
MGIVAERPDRFRLPARIRASSAPQDEFSCRLALADRIAALPGIVTEDDPCDALPNRASVYLQLASPQFANRTPRRHLQRTLLCTISCGGVELFGLDTWGKHQVLSGGWGSLQRDYVLLYLPRDEQELDVCWNILRRTYQNLSTPSARPALAHLASIPARPRFSRTTLQ